MGGWVRGGEGGVGEGSVTGRSQGVKGPEEKRRGWVGFSLQVITNSGKELEEEVVGAGLRWRGCWAGRA